MQPRLTNLSRPSGDVSSSPPLNQLFAYSDLLLFMYLLDTVMGGKQTGCLSSSVLRYVQRNDYKEVETAVDHYRGRYHAQDQDPGKKNLVNNLGDSPVSGAFTFYDFVKSNSI